MFFFYYSEKGTACHCCPSLNVTVPSRYIQCYLCYLIWYWHGDWITTLGCQKLDSEQWILKLIFLGWKTKEEKENKQKSPSYILCINARYVFSISALKFPEQNDPSVPNQQLWSRNLVLKQNRTLFYKDYYLISLIYASIQESFIPRIWGQGSCSNACELRCLAVPMGVALSWRWWFVPP